ncbi:MAG: hypothetical protein ACTSXP_16165 [Promethearchaeota archaeon]
MKGKLKCNSCGYVFEITHVTFTFDFSGDASQDSDVEMSCPRCGSRDLTSTYNL